MAKADFDAAYFDKVEFDEGSLAFPRTIPVNLSATGVLARSLGLDRAISLALSPATALARSHGSPKTVSPSLSALASVARSRNRDITTASQLKVMPSAEAPSKIGTYGRLGKWQYGEVAEGGGHTAFWYNKGTPSPDYYLWIDGSSYDISGTISTSNYMIKTLIIPGQDYVYIVYSGTDDITTDWVKCSWFDLSGSLQGTKTWDKVSDNMVLLDAIVLEDNRIFLAWYEALEGAETDLPVYFSYGDKDGWTDISAETITPGAVQHNRGSLTQLDSSTIWLFIVADGKSVIHAVKLGISGGTISVSTTYEPLIDNGDGDLEPMGELPYIHAVTVGAYMLIAYQNHTTYMFDATPPIIKGAYIAIAQVNSDATFSETDILEQYSERVARFAFGHNANAGWWIATGRINHAETEFDQLYFYSENYGPLYFGEGGGGTGSNPVQANNSSQWIVARMADTYLHFYYILGAALPWKTVAWNRAASPSLTLSAAVATAYTFVRTIAASIMGAVSVVRKVTTTRASASALSLFTTIVGRTIALIVTACGLTVGATVSLTKGFVRTLTTNATVATAISKSRGWTETLAANLNLTAAISRVVTSARATSTALTGISSFSAVWSGVTNTLITIGTSLTVAASVAYQWAAKRTVSPSLTLTAAISRAVTTTRSVSASITLAVSFLINEAVGRALKVITTVSHAFSMKTVATHVRKIITREGD